MGNLHKHSILKKGSLALVFLMLASTVNLFTPFLSNTARAVETGDILNRARAWSILNALVDARDVVEETISATEAQNCDILGSSDENKYYVGYWSTGNNEVSSADGEADGSSWGHLSENISQVNEALAAVGITDGCRGLIKTTGYTLINGKYEQPSDFGDRLTEKLRDATQGKWYGAEFGDQNPSDPIQYAMLDYLLKNVCGWQYRNPYTANDTAQSSEGERNRIAQSNKESGDSGDGPDEHFYTYTYEGGNPANNTYFVSRDAEKGDAYTGSRSGIGNSAENNALIDCADTTAGTVATRLEENHRFADAYYNLIKTTGGNTTAPSTGSGGGGGTANQVQCELESLGWIICPIITISGDAIKTLASWLDDEFFTKPLTLPTTTDLNQVPLEDRGQIIVFIMWENIRNFANILFILFFIYIIFYVSVNSGNKNYSLKKILPNVIIAAIAVNLSYYFASFVIDISNILGKGVNDLFNISIPSQNSTQSVNIGGGVFYGLAAAASIVGVAVTGTLVAVILPLLATAALGLIGLLLLDYFRDIVLMAWVVLLPLLILFRFMLKDTGAEKLASFGEKGISTGINFAAMYPFLMFALAMSNLLAQLILSLSYDDQGEQQVVYQALAGVGQIAVIVAAILATKGFFGVLERFGAIANNRGKGIIDRARNKGQELKGNTDYQRGKAYRKQAKNEYKNQQFANRLNGTNGSGILQRMRSGYTNTMAKGGAGITGSNWYSKTNLPGAASGQAQVQALNRAATGAAARAASDAVKTEVLRMQTKYGTDAEALDRDLRNKKLSTPIQVEAAVEVLSKSGNPGVQRLRNLVADQAFMNENGGANAVAVIEAMRRNYGDIDAKANDLSTWVTKADAADQARTGTSGIVGTDSKGNPVAQSKHDFSGVVPAKLSTMDPASVRIGATSTRPIDQTNAKIAVDPASNPDYGKMKPETRAVLEWVANGRIGPMP